MKKYYIRKKILSENGGATVLVFFTVFTFLIVAMGAFMTVSILRKSQAKSDIRIQEIYGEDYEKVDEVYKELIQANRSELEKFKISEEYATKNITLTDKYENKIIIPSGFKVASDSGLTVGEGIVIEDSDITTDGNGNLRGNQYVWVPVGEITKQNETKTTITLGRYTFDIGTYDETTGEYNGTGEATLVESAENYEDETIINTYYKELVQSREGVASNDENALNTTALNLKKFIDSVQKNGGYYIARYEASYGVDKKANSKVSNSYSETTAPIIEGALWNFINQIDAANACRNMYGENNTNIETDLVNSYAWDTAIIFIQKCSENVEYSKKNIFSDNIRNTGTGNDEKCKINDMASNVAEWSTEYSSLIGTYGAGPCVARGGHFKWTAFCSCHRSSGYSTNTYSSTCNASFRSILYINI